ncbi:V-type ATP synthase subunit A, partial [bacterium]|nr:V-type ATP synthase subunit A [bacterium]
MNKKGKIIRVAGPLIQAVELTGVKMYEVVNVGRQGLIGEVIEIQGDVVSIQVYEETGGIAPGEPVSASGSPLTVELGPGLIQSIYDGIQRPLEKVRETTGDYILRGVRANGLSREKKWDFKPTCANGTEVGEFSELGTVKESEAVVSKIMVPPGFAGKVSGLKAGSFLVTDEICKVGDKPVQMMFKWPVRTPLPYTKKIQSSEPLVTGTRVIDSFFPIAKGGTGCIPGPFGSGKTVVLHQLAKWADADVVVYVGCGERG